MHLTQTAAVAGLLALFLAGTGCQKQVVKQAGTNQPGPHGAAHQEPAKADHEEADIQAARAELSPEDRRLVDAQEWCPVMSDNRLGVMGAPIKVMVKDQSVFLCCKGCQRKALADPEKTLAKVEELKAKSTDRKAATP